MSTSSSKTPVQMPSLAEDRRIIAAAHEDAGLKLDSVGRIAPTPKVGESGNIA
jgi:hypothetical protein